MLPTISKRDRAPRPLHREPPTAVPERPAGVGGEAGGVALAVDVRTPLAAEGANAERSSRRRGHPVHSSASTSSGFHDTAATHTQTAPGKAGEVTHEVGDRGQSQCNLLTTFAKTSATGPAAVGAPPLQDNFASFGEADSVDGTPQTRRAPTPVQSASAADAPSVQLLQQLQQLLQSGAPTAMLQQWVSRQLHQSTLLAIPARPAAGVIVVPPPSASPLTPAALSAAALRQPTSPRITGGTRPPRRPASAVSFSLSTSPHPHMHQQQQQQLSPQRGSSLEGANAAFEPFRTPSASESACTANSGNAFTALPPTLDGGAGVLEPAMSTATPVVVAVPLEADIRAPLSGNSLPPLTGSAVTASLERGPCSNGADPLAESSRSNVELGARQRCTGGNLRKASRPHLQHSQWRSFRCHSSNPSRSSPVRPSGGAWPAAASGAGAGLAASAIIFHSTPSSPAGTPECRRIASALHSATKAALYATTSQVVAENQQNISLMLGGRFSRHLENFVRRVATPLTLGRSGSPGTPALAGTARGSAYSQGALRGDSDAGSDGDESSITSATSALERLDAPHVSSIAQQTRSLTAASVPLTVAERSAVAAAEFPTGRVPAACVPAVDSTCGPAREFIVKSSQPAAEPPRFSGAGAEVFGSSSAGVSWRPAHGIVSSDGSSLPMVPCDSSTTSAAPPPPHASAGPASVHCFSNSTPPEPSTNSDAEAQLKVSLRQRESSSRRSAVRAARTPLAATEAGPDDTAAPVAAADVLDVVSLIEVDMEAMSASCTPAQESASHNTSFLLSGGDAHQLPRSWGGAAAHAGERNHHNPQRGCISTVSPVNTSASPLLSAHVSLIPSSPAAALATSLSQFTSTSAATQCARRASVPLRRTTSFVSITSSHLGCGGAIGGYGASSLLHLAGRDSASLQDDIPSLGSGHTAGMSLGDGMSGNRRHPSSVLHLSRSSVNGGVDPMNGVMASFILDDISGAQRRSGPRFLRSFCRHTPVRVTESVTHEALEELGVPFIEGIDQASVPTNVLTLMDVYGFTDSCSFYVAMCLNVFLRYAFVQRFGWSVQKLKSFLEVAATYFRGGNPFHNPVHAVDVVMAAHQWASEGSTSAALSDDEVMTFLFTAMVQQLAHTGADNSLLARLKHPYAMLCSYASPQQGATVALVMALLSRPELHFLPVPFLATTRTTGAGGAADPAVVQEWTTSRESHMYDMLADLIMATDERNHATLKQGIVRMGEENARRHGCMCASAHADRSHSILSRHLFRTASQTDTSAQLQYPSPLGSFCLNCCAYITDTHVPTLLKAVLHFIDFAYLFRPYPVYLSGNIAYMAEVYRQMEREYLLLQRVQRQQLLKALTWRAGGERLGEEAPLQPSSPQRFGTPFSASAAGACTPAVTLATALLAEQQPWRQGVAHASTMTSLQRNNDEAVIATDTMPPSCSEAAAALPSEMTASRRCASRSLQGQEKSMQLTSMPPEEDVTSANPRRSTTRAQPLKGLGRDIVLISLEDLCLPFLEQLAPYMPEAWVAASYRNHQTLMRSLPTPEKFDEIVNRLLDMGEETEAERLEEDRKKEGELDDESDPLTSERPFTLPWRLLRPVRPVAAEWTVNKDGLVRRVLMEIMRGPEELLKEHDGS
ncbi:hypothetical protein LSCM1_05576 [Leishmania martiniquensis]|uniref:PDEase domain-containing protein n=1 Tax=Leishmania martiniquensis TaxID=1580590 RepID=A0A836GYN6_9TRYP|nr:hypothetical protein LSCM1_05576 [Leishmania martiniquensis]